MSLNYLGIAHFPVLHHQFSSPRSSAILAASPIQDLTQDSKDVLIDRLNDLVSRLSGAHPLEETIITRIHASVDEIENTIRVAADARHGVKSESDTHTGTSDLDGGLDVDTFWGPPTPTRNIKMRFSPRPIRSSGNHQMITPSKAIEIAKEANDLANKLSQTVKELQARREEADHVHDLLVSRAEKAAERILYLEYHTKEMEEDFESNQSELKFLRIQLQAIEVQASQYIPPDEDPELTQSIMNWKIDWENIEKRSKARRKKLRHSLTQLSDLSTVVGDS